MKSTGNVCPNTELGGDTGLCDATSVVVHSEGLQRLFHPLAFSYSRQLAPSRERKGSRVNKSSLLVHSLSTDKTLA